MCQIEILVLHQYSGRSASCIWDKAEVEFHLSSADGQSNREDYPVFRGFSEGGTWSSYLSLIECTYNNSFHASIRVVPYEALYRRGCKTPLCWYESGESVMLGPKTV